MIVLIRFRVRGDDAVDFRSALEEARAVLAASAGWVSGEIGRSVDEPDLWVLQMRWRDVGSYRRALSRSQVKLVVVPLLARAEDEPSAYELVEAGVELNDSRLRSLP